MTPSSPTPYTAWTALDDSSVTEDAIQNILADLNDDLWVVSACVDRVTNNVGAQKALLELGLGRTTSVVSRCTDILSLASTRNHTTSEDNDVLRTHFTNTPTDGLLCYLRSVLLRRLDRLNTYVEMEKEFPEAEGMEVDDAEEEEWEDDPWGETNDDSAVKTPQSKPGKSAPISLTDFIQNDLLWSACELAASQCLAALRILLKNYTTELWPSRFHIIRCIPEHTHPSECQEILPSIDSTSYAESLPTTQKRREEPDFSELMSTQDALSTQNLPPIPDSDKGIQFTAVNDPLSADEISSWYKSRLDLVMSATGMVDIALVLVQHGASQGVPSMDQLGEELSLLSRLVYDAPQGSRSAEEDWTLDRWYTMDAISVVRAYLRYSTEESLPGDISHLVMPYLYVLEAKAERTGFPDPALPTRTLYEYVLTTSLQNAAAIFEASKPTLPAGQRIIKDDEDMVRLALACLYGSSRLDEWPTMSRIFECLPVWNFPKDDEDLSGDEADTTVASLGAFVTPSTNQPPCTAQDLLLFFKPLPPVSLSRALDILDVHLESGEILSRWSVAAPLRWFLQSSGNVAEQRSWATRMARRAGGSTDKLDGLDDWNWLLSDMWKLTGDGDSSTRGAFCLLTKYEVTSIFLAGLLSTGNFNIAKTMLHSPRHKIKLSSKAVEDICLAASREFYDNSSSGNYNFGDMKLAFECLDVPRATETIIKEKEFIEATSRLCSFNVSSAPGVAITPLEIRLTKDKLSLISRVLSSNNDAYKHTQVILELGYKLGYGHDQVAEVKILAMLADTALQAEDFVRAYENNERMVQVVSELRRKSALGVDDGKAREASEVCWIACFQLGRQSEFPDLDKKMTLLGYALELCPPEKINDVLTAWRRYESQDILRRQERLEHKRTGGQVKNNVPKADFVPINVASSLRAKLHDFHMPSPPLLSTPDAAALASRTFKSVAANFPFSVGSRGRSHASDADDKQSIRSDSTRRTEGEDVSTQASRVLSKGIGWLIGADEEHGGF
ncbi:hypothetical protein D9619_003139 [Psilocybe cf. subviscida]|uniref:Sec39 domain-containing protein n=1 Tax=Psilocybe cf. subviscida TaxID=2480587 RepID=A0A8H5AW82_9AGAR|nr:hypothetical protein D9619_003139 [Psilocybe cf. subviscida]